MRNQRNTTHRVTRAIEVDVLSAEAAAGMATVDHCDTKHLAEVTPVMDESTDHAADVVGPHVKTYTERLAENNAVLRTHGKLIETVVEIAWKMALACFRPNDSYEFHDLAKGWAAEFEALYDDRVASCEWEEDVWREQCEDFTREKIEETVTAGLGRILVRDEP